MLDSLSVMSAVSVVVTFGATDFGATDFGATDLGVVGFGVFGFGVFCFLTTEAKVAVEVAVEVFACVMDICDNKGRFGFINRLLLTTGFDAAGCTSNDFTSAGLELVLVLELDIVIVVFLTAVDMSVDLRMITAAD